MGVCYHLILENAWDFTPKNLKEFEEQWDGYIERKATWDKYVVYNIEKSFPYTNERLALIRLYADNAYETNDHSYGIFEIELPAYPIRHPEYREDMSQRRTEEEKKTSEERVRQKLLKKEIEND